AADPEIGHAVDQSILFLGLEVIRLEHAAAGPFLVGQPTSPSALDGITREQHLAFDAFDAPVSRLLYREGEYAIGNAVQLDLDVWWRRCSLFGFGLLQRGHLLALGRFGPRNERIGQLFAQRDRKRSRPLGK